MRCQLVWATWTPTIAIAHHFILNLLVRRLLPLIPLSDELGAMRLCRLDKTGRNVVRHSCLELHHGSKHAQFALFQAWHGSLMPSSNP